MALHNKVAFDTNMLLSIARFRVDVFTEARKLLGNTEFVVPKQVWEELMKASGKRGKIRAEAEIAIEISGKRGVKIVEVDARNADDALRKMAKDAVIATNDKELKNSVKKLNGTVLYLRQKKFLELS
ncbi:MAG TPA: PIN domain-containing protein [archaeon]|nr:PIN domain-containing protein [archaeon]